MKRSFDAAAEGPTLVLILPKKSLLVMKIGNWPDCFSSSMDFGRLDLHTSDDSAVIRRLSSVDSTESENKHVSLSFL